MIYSQLRSLEKLFVFPLSTSLGVYHPGVLGFFDVAFRLERQVDTQNLQLLGF